MRLGNSHNTHRGSRAARYLRRPAAEPARFALAKTWRVAAGELEFRWEIFNLLNRTNFDLPNRVFGNANFGRIFSAKNPREMQFGARLSF
jgi:hypothetical protein